jgi:dihydroxy-acid dehydratase
VEGELFTPDAPAPCFPDWAFRQPYVCKSSHGFVIGHVVPEAQLGGPIALVQDGDIISVDAVGNTIDLQVPANELERRKQGWTAPPLKAQQGTLYKYIKVVEDASHGCITDA